MTARRAPGPLIALTGAAAVLAFAVDHPLVIAALLCGGLLLYLSAPPGAVSRMMLWVAAVSAAGIVVLTPLVAAQGDLVLLRGPDIPVLDTEVTWEEMVAGLASGARLAAVVLLVAALLAHVDADRLQGLASRLAPRSALVVALAARLLPALERDGRAIGELARLRGVALRDGTRRERAAHAARLMVPLVGSSLERSLDVAAAMAARGYGSGPATRLPAPRRSAAELAVWACAAAVAGVAVWLLATGGAAFAAYPVLGDAFGAAAVAGSAGVLIALGAAAGALRWA